MREMLCNDPSGYFNQKLEAESKAAYFRLFSMIKEPPPLIEWRFSFYRAIARFLTTSRAFTLRSRNRSMYELLLAPVNRL
jgi:hypothetical protein